MEKCGRAGQATDGNMANVHCMLDTQAYKHTLRMCSTYCFSAVAVILQIASVLCLCVHCLCCITGGKTIFFFSGLLLLHLYSG